MWNNCCCQPCFRERNFCGGCCNCNSCCNSCCNNCCIDSITFCLARELCRNICWQSGCCRCSRYARFQW